MFDSSFTIEFIFLASLSRSNAKCSVISTFLFQSFKFFSVWKNYRKTSHILLQLNDKPLRRLKTMMVRSKLIEPLNSHLKHQSRNFQLKNYLISWADNHWNNVCNKLKIFAVLDWIKTIFIIKSQWRFFAQEISQKAFFNMCILCCTYLVFQIKCNLVFILSFYRLRKY